MYQITIGRFIFTTLFRSLTFIASAATVFMIKHYLERKEYEKTMVSIKNRKHVGTPDRRGNQTGQVGNQRTSVRNYRQ